MKNLVLLYLSLCTLISTVSADSKYEISKIRPELFKNADAVVRIDDINFEVKSVGRAIEKTHLAITILNRNADHLAVFSSTYDKLSSVSQLKAIVYNSRGEKVKEFNKGDFEDKSLISDYSIYEDNRIKSIKIYETNYPYTVEFFSVKEFDGLLYYPSWSSLLWFNVSVESSTYSVSIPENQSLRFKESPVTRVTQASLNGKKIYSWQAANIQAFKSEPLSLGISKLVPWAWVAPDEFEYDNTSGNLNTWTSLGQWVNQLNKDGDILSPATIDKVRKLTGGITDRKKIIEVLYNYLQSNTRYVSVQLGVGGFRPITAENVSQVNYGDCKALSNYMKALLKQAGILSHLVVLRSEESIDGSLNESFSSLGQANHMLLCVPSAQDTVWLECTSQRMPVGFLGASNSNRKVLLITQEGGKIARTPYYSAANNRQNRIAEVTINAAGKSSAKITTEYEYEQFENVQAQLFREPKDQKEFLYEFLDIANTDIISFSYKQPAKNQPKLIEEINLNIQDLTANGGDKLFLTLNLMNKRSFVPENTENRVTDFGLQMNYSDTDLISYVIPEGYKVEFIPKDLQLKSEFGEYSVRTSVSGNKITYTRSQKMYSKRYPPERFKELVDFYKAIYKTDKQKAILSKI